MKCGAGECSAVRLSVTQILCYRGLQNSAMQSGILRCRTAPFSAKLCGVTHGDAVPCIAMKGCAVRHSAVQRRKAVQRQCSTVLYGARHRNEVRYEATCLTVRGNIIAVFFSAVEINGSVFHELQHKCHRCDDQ
jgi:hypothetical protein